MELLGSCDWLIVATDRSQFHDGFKYGFWSFWDVHSKFATTRVPLAKRDDYMVSFSRPWFTVRFLVRKISGRQFTTKSARCALARITSFPCGNTTLIELLRIEFKKNIINRPQQKSIPRGHHVNKKHQELQIKSPQRSRPQNPQKGLPAGKFNWGESRTQTCFVFKQYLKKFDVRCQVSESCVPRSCSSDIARTGNGNTQLRQRHHQVYKYINLQFIGNWFKCAWYEK